MIIQGKYNTAHVMIDEVDEATVGQLVRMCSHPAFEGGNIAIMPDCHKGEGSCIGFTYEVQDKIVPNVVGVDIGCGVASAVVHTDKPFDGAEVDAAIRNSVPSGFARRQSSDSALRKFLTEGSDYHSLWKNDLDALVSLMKYENDPLNQLGTLGGGNHFIEVEHNPDDPNMYFYTVHSGSRHFGLSVAKHFQNLAIAQTEKHFPEVASQRDLAFLSRDIDSSFNDYLQAVGIAQWFAMRNRQMILSVLLNNLGLRDSVLWTINSTHNYIEGRTIRKGAISAYRGQEVLIPLNMRDGLIIATGKGNKDWNESAPHGAGRLKARGDAKRTLSLDKFKDDMKDIYTTCVSQATLDESPDAYKNAQTIVDAIAPTVDIKYWLKPIYNFKAEEKV